jgi:hypothetical protein
MNPQDAARRVADLEKLYQPFTPERCKALCCMLERFPIAVFDAIRGRYFDGTSAFDHAKLHRLLTEEHQRALPYRSETQDWRRKDEVEYAAIEKILASTPKSKVDDTVEALRKKTPALRFLEKDLLQSRMGKKLIYHELTAQKAG